MIEVLWTVSAPFRSGFKYKRGGTTGRLIRKADTTRRELLSSMTPRCFPNCLYSEARPRKVNALQCSATRCHNHSTNPPLRCRKRCRQVQTQEMLKRLIRTLTLMSRLLRNMKHRWNRFWSLNHASLLRFVKQKSVGLLNPIFFRAKNDSSRNSALPTRDCELNVPQCMRQTF